MNAFLRQVKSGESLDEETAKRAAAWILSDLAPADEIADFLLALQKKSETFAEINGFLSEIRSHAKPFPKVDTPLLDVCGTGGDQLNTFNVSTGVALTLASLGIPVAKHGNRSVSSRSGSSDVLQSLGIASDLDGESAQNSLRTTGLSFLHAPAFYPVLAKLAPIRKKIGTYTIFNGLGPLLNPAPITHQLMGVYRESLLQNSVRALQARGVRQAYVVHGCDGLDELTLNGSTQIVRLSEGKVTALSLHPRDFGLKTAPLEEVQGGGADENARILMDIFAGKTSAKRDLLVMNAAMGWCLFAGDENFQAAAAKIGAAYDSGVTLNWVEGLRKR